MSEASYDAIRVRRDGGGHIAIVELDNPPLNVITLEVGRELKRACREFVKDADVRVVVFRSAHRGIFTAGADVTMMARVDAGGDAMLQDFLEVADVFDHVEQLPMPTICQLEGIAIGGGFELALACDFRIAGDDLAQLGLPEVRLGLLPGGGGTQRLPRLVGAGVATEMIMKGMRYDAATALAKGLVHEVVAADELVATVEQRAASLARQAPLALRHIKALVRAAFEHPADGLRRERECFLDLLATADAQEGISALTENRRPNFTGV
ncbi:MAG: enoyl-CoA hydratase/carnithine racemase [Thermoleophilia bacterium]|nr:enoyl-CoA hydratase/carnithine racemase [Thermoleophilia bacterium]